MRGFSPTPITLNSAANCPRIESRLKISEVKRAFIALIVSICGVADLRVMFAALAAETNQR
jgi:hypothetical protein